jgi:hypothetical protein
MAVDEARRSQLFGQLAGAVGEEAASTMFDLLPPPDTELATAAGLAELDARMTAGFALARSIDASAPSTPLRSTTCEPRSPARSTASAVTSSAP